MNFDEDITGGNRGRNWDVLEFEGLGGKTATNNAPRLLDGWDRHEDQKAGLWSEEGEVPGWFQMIL